jgi:hypothetical protein
MGEGFVVVLAGLRSIPPECYQASAIDGAGRAATLREADTAGKERVLRDSKNPLRE